MVSKHAQLKVGKLLRMCFLMHFVWSGFRTSDVHGLADLERLLVSRHVAWRVYLRPDILSLANELYMEQETRT